MFSCDTDDIIKENMWKVGYTLSVPEKNSYFSTKTYVVCTQKNRLDKTILLGTQNTCFNWWVRK